MMSLDGGDSEVASENEDLIPMGNFQTSCPTTSYNPLATCTPLESPSPNFLCSDFSVSLSLPPPHGEGELGHLEKERKGMSGLKVKIKKGFTLK